MLTPDDKSRKAYQQGYIAGESEDVDGETDNPYKRFGTGRFSHLAEWWDKGFIDARNNAPQRIYDN